VIRLLHKFARLNYGGVPGLAEAMVPTLSARRLFARNGHCWHRHIGVAQSIEQGFAAHVGLQPVGGVLVDRKNTGRTNTGRTLLAWSAGI
jgi:hypothetical protein